MAKKKDDDPKKPKLPKSIQIVFPSPASFKKVKRKHHPNQHVFQKGNKWAAKKGEVRNPEGSRALIAKLQPVKLLSDAYKLVLDSEMPPYYCKVFGLPMHSSWAMGIGVGMVTRAAVDDTPAAKELREVTEGKLTEKMEHSGPHGAPLAPPQMNVNFLPGLGKGEKEQ
jgi:hypothetical protein